MVDNDVAHRIAREHLACQFTGMVPSDDGTLMELKAVADDIAVALERGEQPTASDINDARVLIHQLDTHLDEICALYDIPRWQTGVQWGELDETEREAYHELEG